jgi:transcriptional regulator with XRE-family HTH domain
MCSKGPRTARVFVCLWTGCSGSASCALFDSEIITGGEEESHDDLFKVELRPDKVRQQMGLNGGHTLYGQVCSREEQLLAKGIGLVLRTIRQQWKLSLREVEERSLRIARERGNQSYQISASWLDRLEREEHELTVTKLMVLADIYNLPPEQLLRSVYPGNPQPGLLRQLSSPNATMLLTDGPLEQQAKYLIPDTIGPDQPPDETTLLSTRNGFLPTPYRRGIIGKLDRTLEPMIPAGSIVHINIRERAISSRTYWTHEFQRPIYFLMTREGYVCGWCELDNNSEWLTLIPHPLSPASSRRWKYRTEIESLGRVIAVAIRLTE